MVLVENVLNREHISYTKLKRVRYEHHTEDPKNEYWEQRITEDVMLTSTVVKEVWNKITKCENFKEIDAKDSNIVIKLKDVTHKIGDY